MDFLLDLLQGCGIAAAIGIRPFLPALLVGALASADLGLDFEGTGFAFLEQSGFLLALLIAVAAVDLAARRRGTEGMEAGPVGLGLAGVALALGALEAAGSLADRGHPVWPGVLAGLACAALALAATRPLLARTRRRLDLDAQRALPLYAESAGLVAAGLAILFPPLSLLVLAALGRLALGGRRREEGKHAGLRILR